MTDRRPVKVWHDRRGVAVLVGRWHVAYWFPGAWLPFTVRNGLEGRRGWWGAARVRRSPA